MRATPAQLQIELLTGALTKPPKKKRNSNAEAEIQAAIVKFIRSVLPGDYCFHIANGGLRSKAEAARFKWQGVVAGIADLEILSENGFHGFIEVKTKGSYLSPEQKTFRAWCEENGHRFSIARSVDDARHILQAWGLHTIEAAP